MYIDSVTLTSDYRCFKSEDKYCFKKLNLLVGDQGSGKSTLLNMMFNHQNNGDKIRIDLSEHAMVRSVKTYYFDSEKHNPRIKNFNDYGNLDGTSRGIGIGAAISLRFSSHGEVLVNFTIGGLDKAKDCIIFLDEPEAGLSLRNQFKLTDSINRVLERNCQLFIATHSIILISSFTEVLSLEQKRWTDSKDFIKLNRIQDA
jgi:predicted ATPase